MQTKKLLLILVLFLFTLTVQSQTKETKKPEPTTQCQAVTQKGTQCSRKSEKSSTLCWQHKKTKDDGRTVKTIKQATKE